MFNKTVLVVVFAFGSVLILEATACVSDALIGIVERSSTNEGLVKKCKPCCKDARTLTVLCDGTVPGRGSCFALHQTVYSA
jgi:hypothetical protein